VPDSVAPPVPAVLLACTVPPAPAAPPDVIVLSAIASASAPAVPSAFPEASEDSSLPISPIIPAESLPDEDHSGHGCRSSAHQWADTRRSSGKMIIMPPGMYNFSLFDTVCTTPAAVRRPAPGSGGGLASRSAMPSSRNPVLCDSGRPSRGATRNPGSSAWAGRAAERTESGVVPVALAGCGANRSPGSALFGRTG
jgi:hypothetical protein